MSVTQHELTGPYDEPTRNGKPFAPEWALRQNGTLSDWQWQVRRWKNEDRGDSNALDQLHRCIEIAKEELQKEFDWSREE